MTCSHCITETRIGENGSWCVACGEKIFDVDPRECQQCSHFVRLLDGVVCNKKLMRVISTMHVTYPISEGSCFEWPIESKSG